MKKKLSLLMVALLGCVAFATAAWRATSEPSGNEPASDFRDIKADFTNGSFFANGESGTYGLKMNNDGTFTRVASDDATANAVVTGKFEIKSLDIKKEVVDPEDVEVLSDMIIGAVNEAIRKAREEKSATMDKISGGLNVPGLF